VKTGNGPAHGTLQLIDGGYTYSPSADYYGMDSFTITVGDGSAEVDCVITMTVNPVNDAPVPTYTAAVNTDEDTPLTESLTATDVDLDTLSYTVKSGNSPAHGTLELIDGGYTYSPTSNYNGTDSFTITVSDGTVDVDCAISVTVNAVNDAPVAVNDSVSTDEDTPITISVLANDSDVDSSEGDTFAPTAILSDPSNGTATISGSTIVYSPAANYYGSDEFTYEITDSGGLTDSATVSISIASVNDRPSRWLIERLHHR
jgi:VCBS repeat-containing protein